MVRTAVRLVDLVSAAGGGWALGGSGSTDDGESGEGPTEGQAPCAVQADCAQQDEDWPPVSDFVHGGATGGHRAGSPRSIGLSYLSKHSGVD